MKITYSYIFVLSFIWVSVAICMNNPSSNRLPVSIRYGGKVYYQGHPLYTFCFPQFERQSPPFVLVNGARHYEGDSFYDAASEISVISACSNPVARLESALADQCGSDENSDGSEHSMSERGQRRVRTSISDQELNSQRYQAVLPVYLKKYYIKAVRCELQRRHFSVNYIARVVASWQQGVLCTIDGLEFKDIEEQALEYDREESNYL